MNYYDLIKQYGTGKGEAVMAATKRVSEYLEGLKEKEPERYWALIKETYEDMCGPHFNEEFAKWQKNNPQPEAVRVEVEKPNYKDVKTKKFPFDEAVAKQMLEKPSCRDA